MPEYAHAYGADGITDGELLPGGESLRAFAERTVEAATIAHDLATENGPVLIVSHRLLIGAVAALHHSYRHPAEIFSLMMADSGLPIEASVMMMTVQGRHLRCQLAM